MLQKNTETLERAIFKTILMADLFDVPLKIKELRLFLIEQKSQISFLERLIASKRGRWNWLETKGEYIYIRGRSHILTTRRITYLAAKKYIEDNHEIIREIAGVPFAQGFLMSGLLPLADQRRDTDPIQLIAVAEPGKRKQVHAILTRSLPKIDPKRIFEVKVLAAEELDIIPHDLFTALRIVNLKPLSGMECYERFMEVNNWVFDYFPNFQPHRRPFFEVELTLKSRLKRNIYELILKEPLGEEEPPPVQLTDISEEKRKFWLDLLNTRYLKYVTSRARPSNSQQTEGPRLSLVENIKARR